MMGARIDIRDNHERTGRYGDGPGGLQQAGTLQGSYTAGRYEYVLATGPMDANGRRRGHGR